MHIVEIQCQHWCVCYLVTSLLYSLLKAAAAGLMSSVITHTSPSLASSAWSPPTYAYINFWYEANAYPLIFFQNGQPQTHVQRLSQTRQRVSQKQDRTAHILIVWLLTHEKWPRPWSVPLTCELVKAKVWTIGRQRVVNCSCMYITTDSWKLPAAPVNFN